ncbi:hypothetical protein GCM10009789_60460 [Kribbella sancticallisti]|uniref:Phenylpyruvate tautomerase PptA, 4-oxalocrotonate tautomerase family n=1 Tax=Kribbella sancticallisti TaxID=460087 RepID=A0ABP4Q777_9ACTN
MPVGYLDVPTGLELGKKRELVKGIYDAVYEVFPFPDDTRIFLHEWPHDSVSQNGALGSEPARPVLVLHVPKGVDGEAKRKMLRGINAAVADAYHLPDFVTFLVEYPLDLVAVDGGILADDQQRVEEQTAVYGR